MQVQWFYTDGFVSYITRATEQLNINMVFSRWNLDFVVPMKPIPKSMQMANGRIINATKGLQKRWTTLVQRYFDEKHKTYNRAINLEIFPINVLYVAETIV